MKKFTLLLALVLSFLLSFGCCVSIHNINSPYKNLIHHITNSTTSLVVKIDNGAYMPYCGAVWINKYDLVTAKHCVSNEDDIVEVGNILKFQIYKDFDDHFPFSKNHKVYIAKIIGQGKSNEDIAVIKSLDDVEHGIVPIATYNPHPGQIAHHIGHPRVLQFSYIKCYVSRKRIYYAWGYDRHVINIVGPIWNGSSGGGFFDNQGNLIGIMSFMPPDVPDQGLIVHNEVIRSILDRLDIKYH